MTTSTHAQAVARVPWPYERTAAMRYSGGGADWSWVVARTTATRIEEVARLDDNRLALIIEALSLRTPIRTFSFLGRPIRIL